MTSCDVRVLVIQPLQLRRLTRRELLGALTGFASRLLERLALGLFQFAQRALDLPTRIEQIPACFLS